MSDNLKLPSWLSRGIEEYFPIKGTDQTFSEIIDHAKKNNKKLRVKLGIDPTGTDIHLGHSILFKLNFSNIYKTCLLNLILKKYKSKNYL